MVVNSIAIIIIHIILMAHNFDKGCRVLHLLALAASEQEPIIIIMIRFDHVAATDGLCLLATARSRPASYSLCRRNAVAVAHLLLLLLLRLVLHHAYLG